MSNVNTNENVIDAEYVETKTATASTKSPKRKNKLKIFLSVIIILSFFFTFVILLISEIFNSTESSIAVTINGDKTNVYLSETEAEKNTIDSLESATITIDTDTEYSFTATNGSSTLPISEKGENEFEVDLKSAPNNSKVIFEIKIGGDGSLIAEAFDEDIRKYYIIATVKNDNNVTNDQVSSKTVNASPTGIVYFGESQDEELFETFESENSAFEHDSFTIPRQMLRHGLKIRVEPTENCARVFIRICNLDGEYCDTNEIRINEASDWAGVMDLDLYQGHTITLRLKWENNTGVTTNFQYISFKVPYLT